MRRDQINAHKVDQRAAPASTCAHGNDRVTQSRYEIDLTKQLLEYSSSIKHRASLLRNARAHADA